MDSKYIFAIVLIVFAIVMFIVHIMMEYDDNPFDYPHINVSFDISGKHQPLYDDYVEDWIINLPNHGNDIKQQFDDALQKWDLECKEYLNGWILWKNHKHEVYQEIRKEILQDDYKMFIFEFNRNQTRYRQENYQRHPYTVENTEFMLELSLKELLKIDDELEEIEYETTLTRWHMREQRRLMTKELRDTIKRRDNFTCQICGKYMPDEVGLHIDHIISVKNGGKSIESNLRVLCDKCNLKKGQKNDNDFSFEL